MTMLTPSEWSTLYSGAPPEELRPKLDHVVSLVHSLTGPAHGSLAIPDRPRTVTIVGGRGQGKSTTLTFAIDLLRDRGRLVLPPVDPERFAAGDTLTGWALAHLGRALPDDLLDADGPEGHPTIRRSLDDLARWQALVSSSYAQGLAQRGVTPEEYARDAARLPAVGVRFAEEWRGLIDRIADAKGNPELQVIVPIDDADLHPSLLPSILADAQALGASPRIVVLIAVDDVTLRQALLVTQVEPAIGSYRLAIEKGLLTPRDVREQVERRMVKHFPRSLRVRLDPVPPDARLFFRPVDRQQDLVTLLESYPLHREGAETLADIFVVRDQSGQRLGPNDYSRCLSENRRDLRQLYEAIERIPPERPNAAATVFTAILRHGLDFVKTLSPVPPESLLVISPDDEKDSSGLSKLLVRLENARFWSVSGLGDTVFRWSDRERPSPFAVGAISARSIGNTYMNLIDDDHDAPIPDADADNPPREEPPGAQAPDALTHLILLAWEGIQFREAGGNLLDMLGLRGHVSTPGGVNWQNQVCDPGGPPPNWTYWIVPSWENHSDYFTFAFGWNRIRPLTVPPSEALGRTEYVELMYLTHIDLVLTVQAEHRVPNRVAEATAESVAEMTSPARWPEAREQYMREVADKFHACIAKARETVHMRNSDFLVWATIALPLMAVRITATERLSEWAMDLWEALPLEDAERTTAADRFANLVSGHLDDYRADPEIEVLSRMDEGQASVLRDLRIAVAQRRDAERAQLLRTLGEQGVPSDILARLRHEGATQEVLITLTALGWPSRSLVGIARAFPSQKEPAPPDLQSGLP